MKMMRVSGDLDLQPLKVHILDDDDHDLMKIGADGGDGRDSKQHVSSPPTTAAITTTTLPLMQSLGLACVYMFASTYYFIGIRQSKRNGEAYDGAFLVLAIEAVKLAASVVFKYVEDGEFIPKTVFYEQNIKAVWRSSLPYAVPSLIYAVYNNMTFYNLSMYDPGTYQVFMQSRILFTGVLFTILFHQALSLRKWAALILLTVGVAWKYYTFSVQLDWRVIFMLLQALLSAFAGVYNEYVFKKNAQLSIHMQNFFIYFYAIFFKLLIGLIVNPSYYLAMDFSLMMRPIFIPIVLCGAMTGLSAAFILKFINVIVKAFASAVEVLITAVVANILLHDPLTGKDLFAAFIVMTAVATYYTKGIGDAKMINCRA